MEEVVARPPLTPRDQPVYFAEDELPTSLSMALSFFLKLGSLWLERRETNARERRGWCCGSPAGCLQGGVCAAVMLCWLWVECCARRF